MSDEDRVIPELSPNGSEFLEALNEGDIDRAVQILRQLDCLKKSDLQELADIFDPTLENAVYNPFKAKLVRRKAGNPIDPLRRRARSFYRASLIQKALLIEKKLYLAIEAVSKQTGLSVSQLKADLRLQKNTVKKKKKSVKS